MLAGTSQFILSSGIHQVPTSLHGAYIQSGGAPLTNTVQAKLIQTSVQGGVSYPRWTPDELHVASDAAKQPGTAK